jgi:23S rRNA (pseudouridine1915-N3)-methyltransferase
MKIKLIALGKTSDSWAKEAIGVFEKRLKHYCTFEMLELPLSGNAGRTAEQIKDSEGVLLLSKLGPGDRLILLDENGKSLTSVGFAEWMQQQQLSGVKNLVFVIGGPYGFSEAVYNASFAKMSLSPMTFTHQMVRLFFTEQLYRAFTILKGEKYHHV